jgi:hypothetical protein
MKGLQVTKQVRSYEKGIKLQKKRYEVTKKIRSYEKGTKLRKRYEVTKMLRKTLVMKLPSYEIVTLPIGIIYYDI